MGTNVLSGSAKAVVLAVGDDTMMGAIEQTLNTYDEPTSFEREMNSISWLLIRLMLVMVPIVFFVQWFNRWRLVGSWRICFECWCWTDT